VQASISYNGRGKVKWGEGNINADPLFVDAQNYHIKDNSSCIGAGATEGIPLTDIEGNYRGAPPDIGAYENSLNRRQVLSIRVPQDQPTIQAGIDVAVNDDIILVDDGVYKGEGNVGLDFKGKAITVRSVNGSASTIIDCQNLYNSGFLFHNGETQSSVLRGFTITKSKAESGGGIYCENASPTISKCIILTIGQVAAEGFIVSIILLLSLLTALLLAIELVGMEVGFTVGLLLRLLSTVPFLAIGQVMAVEFFADCFRHLF